MMVKCIVCGKEYGDKDSKDISYGFCEECLDIMVNLYRMMRRKKREPNNVAIDIEINRLKEKIINRKKSCI